MTYNSVLASSPKSEWHVIFSLVAVSMELIEVDSDELFIIAILIRLFFLGF